MRENSLMALALLGVIIGASGLGFGAYSMMQVQTGAVDGDDGDDGDDGKNGIDAPIKGIVVQLLSNSTSVYDDTDYSSYHTLLSINISVSANSDILCIGTISFSVEGAGGAIMRLWLDDSIELSNSTVFAGSSGWAFGPCTIQGFHEDLSQGFHMIKLQYRNINSPNIYVNYLGTDSVLTVMELAR